MPALPITETGAGEKEYLGAKAYNIHRGEGQLACMPEQVVPAGHIFVMGDNRNNSLDSRAGDMLPLERVRGKAVAIGVSPVMDHVAAAL